MSDVSRTVWVVTSHTGRVEAIFSTKEKLEEGVKGTVYEDTRWHRRSEIEVDRDVSSHVPPSKTYRYEDWING